MARRPIRNISPDDTLEGDPLNEAVKTDRANVADQLMTALDELAHVDQGSIKGILYRIPVPNGKYEWIREVFPPFDLTGIMQELKDNIGGGDYALRLLAEGRVRKTIHFSIYRDVRAPAEKKDGGDMMGMVQIMMSQQAEAARESRSSSDRQMQMMMQMSQQSTQMMLGMITAVMGNQGKATDLIPLIAAMREGKPEGGGLKETIETLAAVKGLLAPAEQNAGFDPEDLVKSGINLIGPVVSAIGGAVGRMRGNPAPMDHGPQEEAAQLALPMPEYNAPPALPPPADGAVPPRVISLIRPDILYFFNRGHDVEKAADAVYDVIDAAIDQGAISEADINELVSRYTISPDWLAELAGYGVDLRANPEWAQQFLSALVAIHFDTSADGDNSGGQGGRIADDGDHGEVIAPRIESHEGAPVSG